jgi:circadian clock protein KaiC
VLYFAFEESGTQIARNMLSVGINLEPFVKNGTLKVHAARQTAYGLEMHLATMHKLINEFKPKIIIVDPMSNMMTSGTIPEVKSMLVRLIDFIKVSQITAMFTDVGNMVSAESTGVGVSSLMDTWILLKSLESYGERNRGIYVLKARGMNHSNQIREFAITSKGVNVINAYSGADGVLAGTARVAQEALDNASLILRNQETARKHRESKRKKLSFEAEFALLKSKYETEEDELTRAIHQETIGEAALLHERHKIAGLRSSDLIITAEHNKGRRKHGD